MCDSIDTLKAPVGLLCDLLAYPELTRLATRCPTFGWVLNGGETGLDQAGYQIRVGVAGGNFSGDDLLWDTGRVPSAQSINIPYAGSALHDDAAYCWTVRTWDTSGRRSEWAQIQSFKIADKTILEAMDHVSVYPLQTSVIVLDAIEKKARGSWVGDFGRAAFGRLQLEVESAVSGAMLTVRLGEACHDGCLDRDPPGAVRYQEVVVHLKEGRQTYLVEIPEDKRNTGPAAIRIPEKFGVVMPFRYIEVEAEDSGVEFIGASQIRLQYPFDETAAHFDSSDQTLNDVWDLCHYTILATSFAGYYVDGDRERIPYEADAYINQLSHYAVDREFSLARRTQEYLLTHPTWPTEWKQHTILIAWADYEATGDLRSLSRCYDVLKDEKLLLQYAGEDGLLKTGHLRDPKSGRTDVGDLVDWPIIERDGFDFRATNTVINAFYYRTLVLMSKIADALGHAQDAQAFLERSHRVYQIFNEQMFDEARGIYVDGIGSGHASQHANLFPLAFGLVPEARIESVVAYVKRRGIACSVYPVQYLLEALFKNGESRHAIGLMTGGGLRSWRNMLEKGATMTWEAWDQSLKPNQDWNHAWAAAPSNIIARYVLGVQAIEPGYGKVRVVPQLGDLAQVEGRVPTIRGAIKVRAWRDNGVTHCDVKAPAGIQIHLS